MKNKIRIATLSIFAVFSLFLFLLAAEPASSLKEIYSGRVYDGDNLTINNVSYTISATEEALVLREAGVKDNPIVISSNDSIRVSDLMYISKSSGDNLTEYMEKYNLSNPPNSMIWKYFHEFVVSEVGGDVTITSSVSSGILYLHSKFNLTVTIENNELVKVTSFRYTQKMPYNLVKTGEWVKNDEVIKDIYSPTTPLDSIAWASSLNPEETKYLISEFEIIAPPESSGGIVISRGNLIFSIEDYEGELYGNTTESKVTISDAMKFSASSTPPLKVGEQSEIVLVIENLHPEKDFSPVNLAVVFPEGLNIGDSPQLLSKIDSAVNSYKFTSPIGNSDKKEITVDVTPTKTLSGPISLSGNYYLGHSKVDVLAEQSVNVDIDGPTLLLSLELVQKGGKNFLDGYFILNNTNRHMQLEGINVDLLSNYSDGVHYSYFSLPPLRYIFNNFSSISLPVSDSDKTIPFVLKVCYTTPYGTKEYSEYSASVMIPKSEFKNYFELKINLADITPEQVICNVSLKRTDIISNLTSMSVLVSGLGTFKGTTISREQINNLLIMNQTEEVTLIIPIPEQYIRNATGPDGLPVLSLPGALMFTAELAYSNDEGSFSQKSSVELPLKDLYSAIVGEDITSASGGTTPNLESGRNDSGTNLNPFSSENPDESTESVPETFTFEYMSSSEHIFGFVVFIFSALVISLIAVVISINHISKRKKEQMRIDNIRLDDTSYAIIEEIESKK